jgi:hypothetical protein
VVARRSSQPPNRTPDTFDTVATCCFRFSHRPQGVRRSSASLSPARGNVTNSTIILAAYCEEHTVNHAGLARRDSLERDLLT